EDYSNENFFAAAVSPDASFAVVGGYRAGTVGGLEHDQDSLLAILDLSQLGTDAVTVTSAKAIELSATEDDKINAVVVSSDNSRIYAAGTVGAQGVVACFLAEDGSACPDFGTAGVFTTDRLEDANGIVVDRDGNILIAGARVTQVAGATE